MERALELDPDLVEALARLAWICMSHDWDWAGADAVLRRALELEPCNLEVVLPAAWLAAALGRFDEALRFDRRAIELDPLRVATYSNLGHHAYYAGRLDEAEAALREGLELNPQLEWLERAYERRDLGLAELKGDPLLASLHRDPRWAAFLAKMGLAGKPSRAANR